MAFRSDRQLVGHSQCVHLRSNDQRIKENLNQSNYCIRL